MNFDGVQTFSATKARERGNLGVKVTEWLGKNEIEIVDKVVTQSSDQEFHCLTITIFYKNLLKRRRVNGG
jgi:hypothetical protein